MLWQTLKSTFIFFLCLLAGGIISYMAENAVRLRYLFPDIKDKESYAQFILDVPPGIWVWILMTHAAGALITGLLLGKFQQDNSLFLYKLAALIWMFYGLVNILYVPHPLWFTVSDLCVYYPMVYIGHQLSVLIFASGKNS
jgi:hypothetical protein